MIYYIGDMHLGHKNVIEYDDRPFLSVDEMDKALIDNWNNKVKDEDHVYIIGDFIYRSGYVASYYLKQLKGHKHLISGNHDLKTIEDAEAMTYFESVGKLGYIQDEGRDVVMCHYPMAEWNGCRREKKPSYHVYSHIHNRYNEVSKFMQGRENALNAGCMINNYEPCTLDELEVNNNKWQSDCIDKIEKGIEGTYLPTYIPEIDGWGVETANGVEIGDLSYVIDQFCWNSVQYMFFDKHHKTHPNHVHGSFEGVIEALLESPSDFSIKGYEHLYSQQEQDVLRQIKETINKVKKYNRPITREEASN